MPIHKDSYNPDSYNAVFARIEQKLEDISSDIKEVKKKEHYLEGRVSALENYKYYFSALIASLSLAATWVWNKVNFK
jgi:hypothetical protein|tara:strand:- start:1002 stop:1232 length:231 start_codon:yes stop_codon:yes gene_type:complete